MYLQKVYAMFHKKSGALMCLYDRPFIGMFSGSAENMLREEIEKGRHHPPLTINDAEEKPLYIIREGEKE